MPVQGYIIVNVEFRREEGKWLGRCPELGTSTFGDSLEEVQEALPALIVEHVNLLEEAGARERFFKKHGIPFHSGKPHQQQVRMEVPVLAGLHDSPLRQTACVPLG